MYSYAPSTHTWYRDVPETKQAVREVGCLPHTPGCTWEQQACGPCDEVTGGNLQHHILTNDCMRAHKGKRWWWTRQQAQKTHKC